MAQYSGGKHLCWVSIMRTPPFASDYSSTLMHFSSLSFKSAIFVVDFDNKNSAYNVQGSVVLCWPCCH